MRTPTPAVARLLTIGASVVVGAGIAILANRELRVTFDARAPAPDPSLSAAPAAALPRIRGYDRIVVPADVRLAGFYEAAAGQLADALTLRSGRRPRVVAGDSTRGDETGGRRIVVQLASADTLADGFRLQADDGDITLEAGTPLGLAHGIGYLTERLLTGIDDAGLADLGRVVTPALAERFVDLGGVGIPLDSAAWRGRDYSHHTRAFTHMLDTGSPQVDATVFAEVQRQFRAYVHRMAAYGYNGVVFKGFLEFVDFAALDGGDAVYPAASPYRQRHRAMRQAFGELFDYADAIGMKVVLSTDMLALTPPLEAYLRRRFGNLDAENPALWDVYRAALAELFTSMPAVDGLMIRVGETGGIFNLEGWDYHSELRVRTVPALHAMLSGLTSTAREHGRRVYFRTWSVGVGETGGMHTRPATYRRIFDGLDEPGLVVSTKFTAGDFYSFLPLNPTLLAGDEPRLVEFQARREYEGFGAFPNYLAPMHRAALQELRSANPNITGIWVWTQEGGPPRVSPMSVYPFHGFWQLVDADVRAAARLGWDPDADVAGLAAAWVRGTFGADDDVVHTLTGVLLSSRAAVLDGLYLRPFATRQVRALGLEPPPMLWVFEWDIVTGSSAALSTIYLAVRDQLDETIAAGFDAARSAAALYERVAAIDPARSAQPELLATLTRGLAYQVDLLRTLALYRQAMLRHYEWLDTGRPGARQEFLAASSAFDAQLAAHRERYADDLDFRSWSFDDAGTGLAHATRSVAALWLARALLLLIAATLIAGALRPTLRASGRAVLVWPLGLIAASTLTVTAALSVAALAAAAAIVGGYLIALRSQLGPAATTRLSGPVAVLLWLTAVPLGLTAVRGPGWFWLMFWTSAPFRTVFVIAVCALLGLLVLATFDALHRAPPARSASGGTLVAFGAPLALPGIIMTVIGLEATLTALNNGLALLPMGLSAILGITVHLGIPGFLPLALIGAGATLVAAGLLLRRGISPAPLTAHSLDSAPAPVRRVLRLRAPHLPD